MPAHRDVRASLAPRSELRVEDAALAAASLAQPGHRCAAWFLVAVLFGRARAIALRVGFRRLRDFRKLGRARARNSGNSENPSANGRLTVSPLFSRSRPLFVPSLL
jgi:hypothetical protein